MTGLYVPLAQGNVEIPGLFGTQSIAKTPKTVKALGSPLDITTCPQSARRGRRVGETGPIQVEQKEKTALAAADRPTAVDAAVL